MKYCTKCGKPLEDGEVCSCQTQNAADAQTNAAQPADGQQAAAQTASTAQATAAQPAKPIITKEQATEISKGMLAFAKDFMKNPVEASEAVVGEHSLVTVAGLVVVNAALELIYKIVHMIVRTAKYGSSYNIADWLKTIFCTVIWWVAIPAALAGLIWVCGKFIEKQDVSFKKALSVFAIPAIPLLVFTVVDILSLVLTHSFFYVIFTFITSAIGGMMLYLTGVGICKVLPRSKNFVYSIGVISAGLWFVDWLVTRAIF